MHKFSDKVPEPTLRRLPWYLSNVKLMKERGETYVSSTQISKQINIDASQIAKDLSYVNISGRTRVGYEIDALIEVLERFLGFTKMHKAFLFGVGSLGGALLRDSGLHHFGLEIVGAFDINPALVGKEINEKLETKFGKLIKGTKYADYSIFNNSLRDSEVFIEKRPKRNTSPVMSITYNGEVSMIWLDYKTGIFYCDDKYMKTCNEYVLSCEDHNPNTLLNASGINLNMLKQLISYFQVGRVRFSDQNIKHLMYDIFRSLGVK